MIQVRSILFLILSFFVFLGAGPIHKLPFLDQIIASIERNQLNWIQLNATLQLEFVNPYEQGAGCEGQLAYQRLGEKLLLHCYNKKNELVFSFKTNDTFFEMYIPTKSKLYQGNIFDLVDSEKIDSHIQPLHLYRALKIFSISKESAEIEHWNEDEVRLNVFAHYRNQAYLSRYLVSTQDGEVNFEIFYDANQEPVTTIHRSDFRVFRPKKGLGDNEIRFPHFIRIETTSPHDGSVNETLIQFKRVGFSQTMESQEDTLRIAPDTEIMNVS